MKNFKVGDEILIKGEIVEVDEEDNTVWVKINSLGRFWFRLEDLLDSKTEEKPE